MQQYISQLHEQFVQVEEQLASLRKQLEKKIDQEYLNGTINDLNPFNILERIRSLEQRLPKMKQECTAIIEAKKLTIDITKNILLSHNRKIIQQLSPNLSLAELHMDTNEQTFHNIDSSFQKQYQLWTYNVEDPTQMEQHKKLEEQLNHLYLYDDLRLSNQSNATQLSNQSNRPSK
jgi:hypothetical protein